MSEQVMEDECPVGQLYVFSAPSGAGKTSLLKVLLEQQKGLVLSVSHTTRAPRPGEVNGTHYHFVDKLAFEAMVAKQDFLESARVFDNYYGTTNESIRQQLDVGLDVVLEIDWQGAQQVRREWTGAITVFILPPSVEALRQRLSARGQDSTEVVERRMRDAVSEISHFDEFDYLVVNDDFDVALADIQAIIQSQRLRKNSQRLRYMAQLSSMLSS